MEIVTIEPAPAAYAGNVTPEVAWQALSEIENSQLVDVRTKAEWAYVGTPDLTALGKDLLCLEWQSFPTMETSPAFPDRLTAMLNEHGATPETPVFFICRSGARSSHAAAAATSAGWRQSFNVATGFEGDRDQQNHRGSISGWKFEGLPWTQT